MSAHGWTGRELRVAINGAVIAAVRTKRVAYSRAPVDITEGERNGYRRLADIGDVRTIEASIDGVATSGNYQVLRGLFYGQDFAAVTIMHADGSTLVADAFLANLSQTGEHDGAVSFSASLLLSGALEDGEYLTSEIYPTPATPPGPGFLFNFTTEELIDGEFGPWGEFGYGYAGSSVPLDGGAGSSTVDPPLLTGTPYTLHAVHNIPGGSGTCVRLRIDGTEPPPVDAVTAFSINGRVFAVADRLTGADDAADSGLGFAWRVWVFGGDPMSPSFTGENTYGFNFVP